MYINHLLPIIISFDEERVTRYHFPLPKYYDIIPYIVYINQTETKSVQINQNKEFTVER